MKRLLQFGMVFSLAFAPAVAAYSQTEGPVPTQMLVNVDAKSAPPADASALVVSVNDHKEPVTSWQPIAPANAQVAVLIDSGLRESVGRELDNLRAFINGLPAGVEVMVGFMQYGSVVSDQPFTADHALAASSIHLPAGLAGMSASPYICLSDFVKKWPGGSSSTTGTGGSSHKARFALMITNGADPYNGSTSIMNQDSPYVSAAVSDSQRAGVSVYAIYFADAGYRGASADNSGQNYLSQITQATGGMSLWEGIGNPVSMEPFLKKFRSSLAETYVATFMAPAGRDPGRDLAQVKISGPKVKLHAPQEVLPGNQE